MTIEEIKEYNHQLIEFVGYKKIKCYVRENTGNINDKRYKLTYIYTTNESKIEFYQSKKLEYPTLDIVRTDGNYYLLQEMWNPNYDWNDLMLCFEQCAILGYPFTICSNYVIIHDNRYQFQTRDIVASIYNDEVSVTKNAYECIVNFLNYFKNVRAKES